MGVAMLKAFRTVKPSRKDFKDLTGQRFGRLVVISFLFTDGHHAKWGCVCDCGKTVCIFRDSLSSGVTQSCGCLRLERCLKANTKHGMANTREYRIWVGIKDRCFNPHNDHFADYGGRGITMFSEWAESFQSFIRAVGKAPSSKHEVGRINNNLGYCPGNVRWETRSQQNNNKRNNVVVVVAGKRVTLMQASKDSGIVYNTLRERLRRGMSITQALCVPI